MNNYSTRFFPLVLLLAGCGQTGPLYLPTDKPPITVSPEQKKELERERKLIQQEKTRDASGDNTEESVPESPADETVKETPPDLSKEN